MRSLPIGPRRSRWELALIGVAICFAACGRGTPVTEVRPVANPAGPKGVVAAKALEPSQDDWPCWRGENGDGIAVGKAPTRWSATENVVWSVDVPGTGHASPIVWGDQIFIATADEKKQAMSLLCYGKGDGATLWTTLLHTGGFMHAHNKNTQASATPACDGRFIYWAAMVKDAIWVSAVDMQGNIAWQTEAGPFVSMHGYGSSPVLYENLVIVQGDSNGPGWLAALDKETGDVYWRVQRGHGASFATPIVAEIAGKPQLLLNGQDKVVSYNPHTGDKLWEAAGPATVAANTMSWRGDIVFASGGYPQRATWGMKTDGSVVWKKNWKCYVPSMLIDGDRLIVPQDDGIVHCVDAATGKEHWSKRVGSDLTSSPVVADGKLYITTESGKILVLKASDKLEQLAENDIGDHCYATPTICGGRMYLRTFSKLYCIADPGADSAAR